MVDLAIAANFVRELTEEQFAERPRHATRSAAAASSVNGSGPARESDRRAPARESGRRGQTRDTRTRNETTGFWRTLARLAQVRG
jgi:hypothetical protein